MTRPGISRLLARSAAAAALWAFPLAAVARADMVQTIDGAWHPAVPAEARLGPDDPPPDDVLRESAEYKVDATYEMVKTRGFSKPAGQVKRIVATASVTNEKFRAALVAGSSSFFADAADLFAEAAGEEQAFGKQSALHLAMLASANTGDKEKTLAACTALLQAFPKSYYFVDAAILRAKIASGDPSTVRKALDEVKAAPGMNARDLFRAEYMRVFLIEESVRDYEKARLSYLQLVSDIEKSAPAEAAVTRQQALVGIGNCLLRTKKAKEAEEYFQKAAKESTNADVLAGAYDGLGSVAFAAAKELQEAKKLPEAKAMLEQAAEHYLRVSLLYRNSVDDDTPVLDALENQAHVFVALFDMSNAKDCDAARRAYAAYFELQGMMPEGIQKKRLIKEGIEFGERKKAAGCGG
jgi:tetratricopeptide (TPR) repeat protein